MKDDFPIAAPNNRLGNALRTKSVNRALIEALSQFSADYLIVGGLAVAWYSDSRRADDMDLLINPTINNSQRVSRALSHLKMKGFNELSFSRTGVQAPLKQQHYADLLTPREGDPSFEEALSGAEPCSIFGFPALVIALEPLLRMKKSHHSHPAGVAQIARDIELLESAKRNRIQKHS